MIKVTPIQTGTAQLKQAQERGRDVRSPLGRKIDIFRDKTWVGPVPILAWLVEHPEGQFIIDTGDTALNSTPGYLPRWNPFFTHEVVIKVAPVEEIGPQLQRMGIDPARDVSAVALTHFHHDHTGGLDHFPHNRIIAPKEGWKIASGRKGMLMGCLPQRWPVWFRPDLVALDGLAVGPFPSSHALTRDGRVFLVPTPGHCYGHASVVARGEGVTYFLAGDATYNEANLRAEQADGVTYDPAVSLRTLRAIKAFAAQEPTIVLPSHDPDSPVRLAAGTVYR